MERNRRTILVVDDDRRQRDIVRDFLEEKYYSTMSFGLRLHNERLVFDPLELRFTLALARPEGSSLENFDFGNMSQPRYPTLDPGAPSVLPYR